MIVSVLSEAIAFTCQQPLRAAWDRLSLIKYWRMGPGGCEGLGSRISGSGFRVYSLRFRVKGGEQASLMLVTGKFEISKLKELRSHSRMSFVPGNSEAVCGTSFSHRSDCGGSLCTRQTRLRLVGCLQ